MTGVLLILLLLAATPVHCQRESDEVPCGLSQSVVDALLDKETRTWTLNDAALTRHDLQEIIDCTANNDTLFLQTQQIIQPNQRLEIRQGLIITGTASDDEDVSSVSITCPLNQGLLHIRGVDLELRGIEIIDCDLSENSTSVAIIDADTCSQSSSIILRDVSFVNNSHLSGSAGLGIQDASCYTTELTRVTMRSNIYSKSSILSKLNTLRNIRLEDNTFEGEEEQSLLLLPPESNTTITGLTVEDNSGTVLRVENGSLEIETARVHHNEATKNGILAAIDTTLTVSFSRFHDNVCNSSGGAIALEHIDASFLSVNFQRNTAENGGAVYVQDPRFIQFDAGRFERNTAQGTGGGLHISGPSENTVVLISDTVFLSNRAAFGGAGVYLDDLSASTVTIQESRFVDNGGTDDGIGDGGALLVSQLENVTFSMTTSTLDSNRGGIGGGSYFDDVSGMLHFSTVEVTNNQADAIGGGMSFWNAGDNATNVTMDTMVFEKNTVDENYGGALHGSGKAIEFTIVASSFRGNEAPEGGAAYFTVVAAASFGSCTFEENVAKGAGGGLWITNMQLLLLLENGLVRNRGRSGGAVKVEQADSLFLHCTFTGNEAILNGGAIQLIGQQGYSGFENSTFLENRASMGGAVWSREMETVVMESGTRFHRNTATRYGGAIFAMLVRSVQTIAIAEASFIGNNASIGGGAAFRIDRGRDSRREPSDWSVQLLDVIFERNRAVRAGGGYFIDDPEALDTDCSLPKLRGIPAGRGYVSSRYQCHSLLHNTVGPNGYGENVATSSVTFTAFLNYLSGKRVGIEPRESYFIPDWRPGEMLPIIEIIMVDVFRQGPALTHPLDTGGRDRRQNQRRTGTRGVPVARVESPDTLIFNQLSTRVHFGRGKITVGVPLRKPGNYSMLLWIENKKEDRITFNVTLRQCGIDEESKVDGTLCIACNSNHYNLEAGRNHCTVCPDHCSCDGWGVAPMPDYWLPSPCFPRPLECLSENACKFERRQLQLTEFFTARAPTCDLSPEDLEAFNAGQCNKGFEGLLCGSCSDGFGQFAMSCYECLPKGIVIMYLFGTVAWLLIVCSAASVGNLTDIENSMTPAAAPVIPPTQVEASPPSGASIGTPLVTSPSSLIAIAVAQRNVTETVKLFLNFAQVNGIALTINAQWTSITERALRSLNFVGAVSVETPISLDCLFPKNGTMPRSVKRTMVTLLIPFAVLAFMSIYWSVRLHRQLDVLKRRLILSVAVVFYVSYIGWVEQLAAAVHCVGVTSGTADNATHRRYWSEDTAVVCYEDSHAVLLWVFVVPMMLIVVLAFPIGSAVYLYLKRRSSQLTSLPVREAFGFMYIAYRDGCVYWECITLLRKAALALVIVFGASLGSHMQGLTAVCVLVFSLYLQTRLLPFREDYPTLNRLEIFSLLVCNFTFISGLYLSDEAIGQSGRMTVSVLAVLLIFSFVAFFVYVVYGKAVTFMRLTMEADGENVEEENSVGIVLRWMRHRFKRIATIPV